MPAVNCSGSIRLFLLHLPSRLSPPSLPKLWEGLEDSLSVPCQNFCGHLLAAVYSELGRETEAQAEAAEVLRINPKFSLAVHKERIPIKDPAMLERQIAALRKAGLK
jgi:hypothetical protein